MTSRGTTADLPTDLPLREGWAGLRRAERADVAAMGRLLAADPLGRDREVTDDLDALRPYLAAFDSIDADREAHDLVVAVVGDEVVGMLQVSYLPGLSRRGAMRAQVESVRVAEGLRSSGLGTAMMTWVVQEARRRRCALVQLTTDRTRTHAHRFYRRLGFETTHHGLKLQL